MSGSDPRPHDHEVIEVVLANPPDPTVRPSFPWQSRPVDEPVRQIVDALNAVKGVATYASCGGHRMFGTAWCWVPVSQPYISFVGPEVFAAALGEVLHRLSMIEESLNYYWVIEALHVPSYRFVYRIAPQSPGLFKGKRRKLDQDIARLTSIVRALEARVVNAEQRTTA